MKAILAFIGVAAVVWLGYIFFFDTDQVVTMPDVATSTATTTALVPPPTDAEPVVKPISHATMALTWKGLTIITDPVGDITEYQGIKPDIILITDIHSDHLSTTTLKAIMGTAAIIVPQAVEDLLPKEIADRTEVLKNNERKDVKGFSIMATPMYSVPESADARHTKGRGNGYLIERDGYRVYVAGDTGGTPEMRALTDIDIAFIPMNLPFTMTVDEAADAVKAFKPRVVYPYHYRGQDGLADVARFKTLVEQANVGTKVILLDWYPKE